MFLAIAPSRHAAGALELSGMLTRAFAALRPDGRLEDLVGHDDASTMAIAERESRRLVAREEERAAIRACIDSLARGAPFRKLQQQTVY